MEEDTQNGGIPDGPERQQEQIRRIIYQIRRLMQAGYQYTKELNKNYQVSAPQLNCLLSLYEKGPLPPSRIARQIMLKSSTLTGVIDRLEVKGLVKRTRSSQDRRVITIELTEAGRVLARNAPSHPAEDRRWSQAVVVPPASRYHSQYGNSHPHARCGAPRRRASRGPPSPHLTGGPRTRPSEVLSNNKGMLI